MSETVYNEFRELGVSITRVLNDLKVTGPESALSDETNLQDQAACAGGNCEIV